MYPCKATASLATSGGIPSADQVRWYFLSTQHFWETHRLLCLVLFFHCKRGKNLPEKIQKRATNMFKELKYLSHEEWMQVGTSQFGKEKAQEWSYPSVYILHMCMYMTVKKTDSSQWDRMKGWKAMNMNKMETTENKNFLLLKLTDTGKDSPNMLWSLVHGDILKPRILKATCSTKSCSEQRLDNHQRSLASSAVLLIYYYI